MTHDRRCLRSDALDTYSHACHAHLLRPICTPFHASLLSKHSVFSQDANQCQPRVYRIICRANQHSILTFDDRKNNEGNTLDVAIARTNDKLSSIGPLETNLNVISKFNHFGNKVINYFWKCGLQDMAILFKTQCVYMCHRFSHKVKRTWMKLTKYRKKCDTGTHIWRTLFNSLRLCDTISCLRSWLALFDVMAWCPSGITKPLVHLQWNPRRQMTSL